MDFAVRAWRDIADLSDPRWVLAELQQIVRSFRSLPAVPILQAQQQEREVVDEFEGYPSVHPVVRYQGLSHLEDRLGPQKPKLLRPG